MCTVTYIRSGTSVLITSNRDEEPSRNAGIIRQRFLESDDALTYPEEPQAKGSWIAVQNSGKAACLLNGAFEPYDRNYHSSRSRGRMLLESFEYEDVGAFLSDWDFGKVAPFTMIFLSGEELSEIIWDGTKIYSKKIDAHYQIWSSVQLYTENTRVDKARRFSEWMVERDMSLPSQEEIIEFHQTGHPDFLIENEYVKTVSVSSILVLDGRSTQFEHIDLIGDVRYSHKL